MDGWMDGWKGWVDQTKCGYMDSAHQQVLNPSSYLSAFSHHQDGCMSPESVFSPSQGPSSLGSNVPHLLCSLLLIQS